MSNNESGTFGEWLRLKINENRIKNAELARRVNLSPTYIGNLVRDHSPNSKTGKIRASEEVIEAIAKALNADLDEARAAAGYAPLSAPQFPDGLNPQDFDGLDSGDLKEIINFIGYIRFKKSQEAPLKDGDILNVDNGNILRKIN